VRRQAAEEAQLIGAASSTAVEGDLALTERDFRQAAKRFGQAAALLPPGQAQLQAGYHERQVQAFYRQGEEKGDDPALEQAIAGYRDLLEEWTRERVPLSWATTQNNLGIALQGLGERLRREELLREALQATHQAQAVYADAGLRKYEAYFATRIAAVESAIRAMGKD
jgi:tetratricopeptide (TPR) repeat protein